MTPAPIRASLTLSMIPVLKDSLIHQFGRVGHERGEIHLVEDLLPHVDPRGNFA